MRGKALEEGKGRLNVVIIISKNICKIECPLCLFKTLASHQEGGGRNSLRAECKEPTLILLFSKITHWLNRILFTIYLSNKSTHISSKKKTHLP